MGLWPLLPGFVRQVRRSTDVEAWSTVPYDGWERVYDLSYFFGVTVAGGLYASLSFIFRPAKMRGDEPFEMRRRGHAGRKMAMTTQEKQKMAEAQTAVL